MRTPDSTDKPGTARSRDLCSGTALALLGGLVALSVISGRSVSDRRASRAISGGRPAKTLHRASSTLAACVLLDSAIEHYRGSFHNRGMWVPLVSATLALGAGVSGGRARSVTRSRRVRGAIYTGAVITGLIGTAFHLYNIGKRLGGFCWLNLFYAAPIAAPAALSFAGVLGTAAERLNAQHRSTAHRLLGLPAGRLLASLTSAGLIGTVGEAALLHFRGAYQNPAMLLPVSVPPVAAVLLALSAIAPSPRERPVTRWWLRMTALLGLAGSLFHAYGVGRSMGGWRNWRQNVLSGPPLPAPPSFTALAVAGLAALDLMRADPS